MLMHIASAATKYSTKESFRKGLFDVEVLQSYTKEYADSTPYKHAVIQELMDDVLLRAVRDEVRENVHFTPKETDIYKIHQSGDLANLDGLDDAALKKLPSLLKLRDALYSPEFRKYVAHITGSGAVSGKKTDMAINVYTPGCHLLCHDDVIGSRRISYILYLVDPDIPWKEEWGGALRLFPTVEMTEDDGHKTKTPGPDHIKSIPPAWNQLSFFAVQPGESFHDVEEVYHAASKEQQEKEGGRVRMAISGWYHIPQKGEEGYIEGAEEKLAEKSSLVQLQGKADRYDFPQEIMQPLDESMASSEDGFGEKDIDFLLQFMAPAYLTPETLEQVGEHFEEQSAITLDNILSKKFSTKLNEYIKSQESSTLPTEASSIESSTDWKVARPPHKHRFLYQQDASPATSNGTKVNGKSKAKEQEPNPLQQLIHTFLPSPQFQHWLSLATSCELESSSILARRFRKGLDYALATNYEGDARLEVSLMLTPTPGWGGSAEAMDDDEEEEEEEVVKEVNGKKIMGPRSTSSKQKGKAAKEEAAEEEDDVGGHEVYMAGDDDEDGADAAIYKTSDDADDNVLFTVSPSWNKMSIVLRDSGVLKFVKYVSKKAKGDRWDVLAAYGVKDDDEDDDSAEPADPTTKDGFLDDSGGEDTFNGFPDSEDSDSE